MRVTLVRHQSTHSIMAGWLTAPIDELFYKSRTGRCGRMVLLPIPVFLDLIEDLKFYTTLVFSNSVNPSNPDWTNSCLF